MRECLFVGGLGEACFHPMQACSGESHINVGIRTRVSIVESAHLVGKVVGYEGRLEFDDAKPNGTSAR